MSRGDPQGKICRHIRRPGFVRVDCVGGDDTIRLRGSTGATEVKGSFAREAKRFV